LSLSIDTCVNQALKDDNSEIFVVKAAPAPLNDELLASVQGVLKIPVQNSDQIKLQLRVRFGNNIAAKRFV
jgi:hypothetical protein